VAALRLAAAVTERGARPDEAAIDAAIDALYGGAVDDFVARRNALAVELRKAGARDEATRVKALVKPSVAAWTVGQLHRRRRDHLDALLAAGGELRAAQRRALEGGAAGAGATALRAAQQARSHAMSRLLADAREILRDAGHPDSSATVDRIAATLQAIATLPEPPRLTRLAGEVAPMGLEDLLAMGAGAETERAPVRALREEMRPPEPRAPEKDREREREKDRERQEEREREKEREREREKERDERRRLREAAEHAERQARAVAAEASRRAEEAAGECARVAKAVEQARAESRLADRATERSREVLERARREAEAAERAAAEARQKQAEEEQRLTASEAGVTEARALEREAARLLAEAKEALAQLR
jgi:hypothetical protein